MVFYIGERPKEEYLLNTELLIAIVGALVTVITAILTNFFTKRNQLRFEERKLKEQFLKMEQAGQELEDSRKKFDNLSK